MQSLENKVPPPVVAALCAAAMWLLAQTLPALRIDIPLRLSITVLLVLSGGVVAALGVAAFSRSRTTTDPMHPERASALVTKGVFRYTRNPMYLGLTMELVAWSVYMAAPWALLGAVVFVIFLTRFQIMPEERMMTKKFGLAYAQYQAQVRRWV